MTIVDHKLLFDVYPVTTVEGVKKLLRNIHHLRERRYGDFAVCDLLMDLEAAIEQARLTPRQRQVLSLYYERDMDIREIANVLKVSKTAVYESLDTAIKKITRVFEEWGYGERTPVEVTDGIKAAV